MGVERRILTEAERANYGFCGRSRGNRCIFMGRDSSCVMSPQVDQSKVVADGLCRDAMVGGKPGEMTREGFIFKASL